MLTGIQSLKSFGIFDDYTRPVGTKDFSDRNIIYGWNYSGKTTLSRLVHALGQKAMHPDMVGGKFSVTDQGGATITDDNLAASTKTTRVFNSDFVAESLNWNGGAFRPILLLGAESREAQEKIDHYERVTKRCGSSAIRHRLAIQLIDNRLAEAKTAAAKRIKATLDLAEPFTSVHLGQQLTVIGIDSKNYTLPQEQFNSDLSLATSSEKDRLPVVVRIQFSPDAGSVYDTARALLIQRPASSHVIEALAAHPDIARWVSEGLRLHQEKDSCEFCRNPFSADRRAELQAHFSKEVQAHKDGLEAVHLQIKGLKFKGTDLRESDLNAQFRPHLKPLLDNLQVALHAYCTWIEELSTAVQRKLNEQFVEVQAPVDPTPLVAAVADAVAALNKLVDDSNGITSNFVAARAEAIRRLKLHFAYEFHVDNKLDDVNEQKASRLLQVKRYDAASAVAGQRMKEQQARINKAQNGRVRINERIASLLSSSAIQIDVVSSGGVDNFILKRGSRIAKHLSEGEKTAIAFAFFLTKLQEEPDLENVIVYIDDPISSLDSNHIFQVYSILRSIFFKKNPNNQKESVVACKQLFVSTHNFEFFSLLRDLPGTPSYFLTKRISPTRSTLVNLPESISAYSSEYHYLFHILHNYHTRPDKADDEYLMLLPNAARRFVELYTYARRPLGRNSPVEKRAELVFGVEKAHRILKVLHHFSHLASIERLVVNTNLVADIDGAIATLMEFLATDKDHYAALLAAVK
jgi:wobble nucleotide-excising tRNase